MHTDPSVPEFDIARRPHTGSRPHHALTPYLIGRYQGFDETIAPSGQFVLPATTSVILILKIGDPPSRPPQFLHGAHGSYAVVDGSCSPAYVEVRLAPLGAYTLFGLPLAELSEHIIDLGDVLGKPGRTLAEKVRDTTDWNRRFSLLDDFLLERVQDRTRPSPEVARAWHCLTATGGAISIGQLATEVGWSRKHLITKFRQQIGLPPKKTARLVRFDRALTHLTSRPLTSWEKIAADSGYADQAHFTREFREFTGSTPSNFLSTVLRSHRSPGPDGQ